MRTRVRALHEAGLSGRAIAKALGVSPSTVSYHLRRLGVPPQRQPRYDWQAIRSFYENGYSYRECRERFGFSSASWSAAARRGAVLPRGPTPLDELLTADRRRSRGHIKRALLRAGLKEHRCEDCGLSEWRGRSLSLALHHVNGEGMDNRLENLRLLCPNCHSQTENFAGRKTRRVRGSVGSPSPATQPRQ